VTRVIRRTRVTRRTYRLRRGSKFYRVSKYRSLRRCNHHKRAFRVYHNKRYQAYKAYRKTPRASRTPALKAAYLKEDYVIYGKAFINRLQRNLKRLMKHPTRSYNKKKIAEYKAVFAVMESYFASQKAARTAALKKQVQYGGCRKYRYRLRP